MQNQEILNKLSECVEFGKVNKAAPYPPAMKDQDGADELTRQALDMGIESNVILNEALIAAMDKVGEKFTQKKIFVPQMLISAKAMNAAMEHLKPFFQSGQVKRKGKMIIGTVSGDLHDIGKNLVEMAMRAADSDPYVDQLIDQLILECKQLAEPAGWVQWVEDPLIDVVNQCLYLEGARFSTANTVSGMLKKTELLAVFAVTIGHRVEQLSKAAFAEGNALEGLIVDLIGSELAEATADCLQAEIEKSADANGMQISMRFSPGYCNWPVSDQPKLFALFEEGSCSIRLNDSSLMSPVKSVSGFIGAGSKMKKVNYKCSLCNDEHCTMRRRSLYA